MCSNILDNFTFMSAKLIIAAVFVFWAVSGCSALKKKQEPDPLDARSAIENPLPPEEAQGLLEETGSNWLYGQGFGETALTVGTVIAFPPYVLWVAGNAALSFAGYEPLQFSDALPDEEKEAWTSTYDTITSQPGRLNAAIAGEEFRTKEVAKENIKKYLEQAKERTESKPYYDDHNRTGTETRP